MKEIIWVGSALDDVRRFPADARQLAGFELSTVQDGGVPSDFKPMPAIGPGTYEIRIRTGLAHRIFYVAKFSEAIYVLHAFEKRSRATSPADLETARRRYRTMVESR